MTRRKVLIFAGIITINILILAGVYLWQNLVFTGETRAIPDTPHRFVIQSGVSEADLALVSEGIQLAEDYFASQLGTTLPNPIEVRLASTTPCIPFTAIGQGSTAVADETMLCIDTIGYTWTQIVPQERLVGLSIVAHEHFHNLQGQLGCLPGPNEHEYAWWVEGSATYVGWHSLVEAGSVTEADVLARMREWGGFSDDLRPLMEYERRISGDAQYALAYRAIAQLVERTGIHESLYQFCEQVGSGENWRTAFEAAYGIPVEDFYVEFEQLRQTAL